MTVINFPRVAFPGAAEISAVEDPCCCDKIFPVLLIMLSRRSNKRAAPACYVILFSYCIIVSAVDCCEALSSVSRRAKARLFGPPEAAEISAIEGPRERHSR